MGARLIRCGVFPRLKDSTIGICLNYASFPLFAFFRIIPLLFKKYDKVFVYEPSPIFQCIPALIFGAVKRIEKIIYVLDIWPDSVYSVVDIRNKFFRRLLYKYCCHVYKKFDRVLVTSRGFIPLLEKQGVQKDRMEYFPQWASGVFTGNAAGNHRRESFGNTFNIVFAGNIGVPQGLNVVIRAALLCRDITKLRWILVGDGDAADHLKEKITAGRLEDIVIMPGRKPLEEMPGYYDAAGALLVTLKNIPLFQSIVPAKVQSYMASGKPLVAALDGEAAELIRDSGCGLVGPAEDAAALAANVRKLMSMNKKELDDMGLRGKEYADTYFNKHKLLDRLESILC